MSSPSKSLRTIVDDIYALFTRNPPVTEAAVEELGRSLTTTLKRHLSTPAAPRGLTMSSVGSKCKRQLWYKVNTPEEGEPIPAKAKLNYLAGAIWEDVILTLAKEAGHSVRGEQDEVELAGVKGHRDAVIDGVVVDVKSANSRSIEKFKKHALDYDDPFGYRRQLDLYREAGQEDPLVTVKGQAAFLAVDKELGGLYLDVYPRENVDHIKEIEKVKSILAQDEPPPRAFKAQEDGAYGNEVIPKECRYCEFKNKCWSDANNGSGLRKFFFSNGPKWFTKVVREPRVEEENKL